MRYLAASILLLASCLSAQAATVNAWMVGIGQYSCATWLSDQNHENQGVIWIWGFWSGENAQNTRNHEVGKTTDGPGIVAVVKQECQRDPAQSLATAVGRIYYKFSDEDYSRK